MAVLAGYGGSVKISTDVVLEVESWSLSIDGALVDSHSLGDEWGETTQTVKKWTATINFKWDAVNDTTGQAVLETALLAGTSVSDINLFVNTNNYYTGKGKVANGNYDVAVDDLVTGSFEIMGEGSIEAAVLP